MRAADRRQQLLDTTGDLVVERGFHAVTIEAVANAAGVTRHEAAIVDAAMKLGKGMQGALSSTAHDLIRGRRTEIDALNGFVVHRGAELGVPTPANQALVALVKLREHVASDR